MEEERIPLYDAKKFLPVRLGDILNDRYRIVTKLGFGTTSTVWLVRDQQEDTYYALKACITGSEESNEVKISDIVRAADSEHPGLGQMRVALDKFTISGPTGQHQCLVFEPCGSTYHELCKSQRDGVVAKDLMQYTILIVLYALDALHQLGVVHTDLSPNNILLGVDNKEEFFGAVERWEEEIPSEHKILHDRVIYRSRLMPITNGLPMVTDFGAAYIGEPGQKHTGDVMPGPYRAPEVILAMPWDDKVDIWSVGTILWDLFEHDRVFNVTRNGMLNDEQHLAEMVALMGPPPKEFLQRSSTCEKYWDSEGNWKGETPIPTKSFESKETRLAGEDKALLLALLRKIFRWLPEERPSASDLVSDAFISQVVPKK